MRAPGLQMDAEAQLVAEAAAEPGAGVGGSVPCKSQDVVAIVASGPAAARKRAAAADAPRMNRKHQHVPGTSRIGSRRLEPPKTIKQILNWPSRYMRLLPQEGLGIIATLFHEKGLALSTNYSGIGMWECGRQLWPMSVRHLGRLKSQTFTPATSMKIACAFCFNTKA